MQRLICNRATVFTQAKQSKQDLELPRIGSIGYSAIIHSNHHQFAHKALKDLGDSASFQVDIDPELSWLVIEALA